MRILSFHRRSLQYHKRANFAVAVGIAVGSAALTGALLVGDSMRGSLREVALDRLGRVDHAVVSARFFRTELATDIQGSDGCRTITDEVVPVIVVSGGISHAETRALSSRITILGIGATFWSLDKDAGEVAPLFPSRRSVLLNRPLADELGAKPGDDVLLRVGKPSDVSAETLLGRRDETTVSIRLTVSSIVEAKGLGAFGLKPQQSAPKNAYLPIATLQRALGQVDRVNTLLMASSSGSGGEKTASSEALQSCLASGVKLADLGLRLRIAESHGYFALESDAMLLGLAVEKAAMETGRGQALDASRLLTYLANRIRKEGADDSASGIPYSTVTAIEAEGPVRNHFLDATGQPIGRLELGKILLNQWAADDLNAVKGDRVLLEYFVTGAFADLETRQTAFVVSDIVALSGRAADQGFTPQYKGVTDTENLAEWDAPFPMDLSIVRDKDEQYWDTYNATPKAFVSLVDGQRLWAENPERFGRISAIHFTPTTPGANLSDSAAEFESEFLQAVDPKTMGLRLDSVRQNALHAATGSTDFGMLFIGFSFFLIASAAMLVALLFRLGVERRSSEVGLLLAIGFTPRNVVGMLLIQGMVLAVIGSAIGQLGALGYAWLMLAGLRSWWSDAVNSPFLTLHFSATTFGIGFVANIAVAVVSIAWSVRGLTNRPVRSLLAGAVAAGRSLMARREGKWAKRISMGSFTFAVVFSLLPLTNVSLPSAILFFLSGAAILVGGLGLASWWLGRGTGRVIRSKTTAVWFRMGMQNARRQSGRSLLTAGLVASACFLIVALEAFHLEVDPGSTDRKSGTGGFTQYAESAVPLLHDLNRKTGRESLNVDPMVGRVLDDVSFMPFRLRPGEGSGCTNLYRPTEPRILGATSDMLDRGGFVFSSTLAQTEDERQNPWQLLNKEFPDGAVPVIGDEASVLWQLHLGLGKDLIIDDGSGQEVHLRFVALLSGSAIQDELVLSESNFERLFPKISGYGFFLIETPLGKIEKVEAVLEEQLTQFGFDVGSTSARLAGYLVVQNTYLRTFQTLGGFGLILGTIGLAAVLLRNVWERRGELALMQAVGFSPGALGLIVLAENISLLVLGLVIGTLSALWAVAPHLVTRVQSIPWLSLGSTLMVVLVVGVLAGTMALVLAFRTPLLPALRSE